MQKSRSPADASHTLLMLTPLASRVYSTRPCVQRFVRLFDSADPAHASKYTAEGAWRAFLSNASLSGLGAFERLPSNIVSPYFEAIFKAGRLLEPAARVGHLMLP